MAENNNSNKSSMVNIGGLWLNRKADGEVFFSGSFNGAKLLIFKNNFKESDNHPDYIMWVTARVTKQETDLDEIWNDDIEAMNKDKDEDEVPF